jgi:hypothetical protein
VAPVNGAPATARSPRLDRGRRGSPEPLLFQERDASRVVFGSFGIKQERSLGGGDLLLDLLEAAFDLDTGHGGGGRRKGWS